MVSSAGIGNRNLHSFPHDNCLRLQAAAHTPSTKQRVVEVQPVEDDLAKPKPPNAEKTAPGPPGTPVSAWPRAPPRFTSTPEQRRGQPLNANDDALEFTCGGQEVRGIKLGAEAKSKFVQRCTYVRNGLASPLANGGTTAM